ncbi:MAG: hypothetical protein P4L50_07675 [Anaerolineaceae bacterium]|nr:hypothetical protein [Anaerolineaceae bacterium]
MNDGFNGTRLMPRRHSSPHSLCADDIECLLKAVNSLDIRFYLPLERLIKVNGYVADAKNGLPGILDRISAVELNAVPED